MNVKNIYKTQESQDAKRLRGLLSLYDSALTACVESDMDALESSLDVLQAKLDFDVWPVLGLLLFAQYNRCRELGRKGEFIAAGRVLAKLRSAWTNKDRLMEKERVRVESVARALRIKELFEKEAALSGMSGSSAL